jgi:hypothetical protein
VNKLVFVVAAAAAVGPSAGAAGAAATRIDASGTVVLNGNKTFPIVLSKGPPPGARTPSGGDALAAIVGAGVRFFKVDPPSGVWTSADVAAARRWNRAAAAHRAFTWINLSTLSRAAPGAAVANRLDRVVRSLTSDRAGRRAIAMWKGADEPLLAGVPPASLEFAYCLATARGDPGWCGDAPSVDSAHLWVTIEAPRGAPAELGAYSAVTDTHGVDVYPIALRGLNPDLHQVGVWTSTLASVTPNHSVWTTLQVCASPGYDRSGDFLLPTFAQERYMVYDAIINGARDLAFYGADNRNCWNDADRAAGWNWTFWNAVLEPLVGEIAATSPLAAALVEPESTQVLPTTDPATQAILRRGSGSDLWLIAARSGSGTATVSIAGLPPTVTRGAVYTERRSVPASGSLTDEFAQWGVHVYHFTPPGITSWSRGSGRSGARVTLRGTRFRGTTAVAFNGTAARYSVLSDTRLVTHVPQRATTGPVSVTTRDGTATSATSFVVRS